MFCIDNTVQIYQWAQNPVIVAAKQLSCKNKSLTDGKFFHVTINEWHRWFLRLLYRQEVMEMSSLLFELNSAS